MNDHFDKAPRPWDTLSELRDAARGRRETAAAEKSAWQKRRRNRFHVAAAIIATGLSGGAGVSVNYWPRHEHVMIEMKTLGPMSGSCALSEHGFLCEHRAERGWFDPRWMSDSWPYYMEGARPPQVLIGERWYAVRDLMGRRI